VSSSLIQFTGQRWHISVQYCVAVVIPGQFSYITHSAFFVFITLVISVDYTRCSGHFLRYCIYLVSVFF